MTDINDITRRLLTVNDDIKAVFKARMNISNCTYAEQVAIVYLIDDIEAALHDTTDAVGRRDLTEIDQAIEELNILLTTAKRVLGMNANDKPVVTTDPFHTVAATKH